MIFKNIFDGTIIMTVNSTNSAKAKFIFHKSFIRISFKQNCVSYPILSNRRGFLRHGMEQSETIDFSW